MFNREDVTRELGARLDADLFRVCSVLEQESVAIEGEGVVTGPAWDAMSSAGLFHSMVPTPAVSSALATAAACWGVNWWAMAC